MTPEQKQENYLLAQRIIGEQSFRAGLVFGVLTMLVFVGVWAIAAAVTGRVLGAMAVPLGAAVGYAVQIFGKGVEVRFAFLAAALAVAGTVLGIIVAAILVEILVYGVTATRILAELGPATFTRFVLADLNLMTIAFWIMSISAAAYIANRRLNHVEALALFTFRFSD